MWNIERRLRMADRCGPMRASLERVELRAWIVVAAALLLQPITAGAQSTLATVLGTVYDEQRAVVPGATITLRSFETDQTRNGVSDATGNFRVLGLPPGRYEMHVEHEGFLPDVESNLQLTISAEAKRDVVLKLANLAEHVTVSAAGPLVAISKTALGRTVTMKEIDELPVGARNFTNLALLTPGILGNSSTSRDSDPGIVASGQIGRNNTFIVDGLSLDAHLGSGVRGGLSLDTVKEFVVLSNNFSAEYGHAAGAVVSVLTRSGTNRFTGRAFYYHRDDAWDATDATAALTVPPGDKTKLEQKDIGGFWGGPIVPDRAFFFGSVEHTRRDSESIVTSPVLRLFRPAAPTHLPVLLTNPQIFARGDFVIGERSTIVLRSRFDRISQTNQAVERQPAGFVAPERRQDRATDNYDLAGLDNHVLGSRAFNELRFQFAGRTIESNVDTYCAGCVTENRPNILLGKSDIAPERSVEQRWQFADALTYAASNRLGEHAFKGGIDASAITISGFQPAGFDGAFTFRVNTPFDAADRSTYPVQYRRNSGESSYDLSSRVYGAFIQDEWKPAPRLALNLGARWDYEDSIRVAGDANNIAPRIGVAFDPWRDGRMSIRGGYGFYYDAVLFQALVNTFRGSQVGRIQVVNPGYPDPFGPNPNRNGAAVNVAPNGRRFADSIRTPYTEQASIGVRRLRGPFSITADAVWARGRNLIRTRDGNYPNLDDPLRGRPDPSFQEITVRETEGRSLHRALQIGVQKRHARRHSYAIAYTLSHSERDTEDWDFLPQDQRVYGADWGPSSSDARHRLAASANVDLMLGFRVTTVVTGRSALPYNVTMGNTDVNRDGYFTDRPPGAGRNSARGDDFWQVDARLSRAFRFRARQVEFIAEAFNMANRRNWTGYDGVQGNATFGRPTDAANPREVQIGIRVDF
jgi:hypothetical protein